MFNCLDEIRNFKAKKLRPVQTKVVTSDGKHYVESRDRSGAIVAKEVAKEQRIFVPDTTPDLQVAQILPGLVLGSQDVAQDLNVLKQYNITHILNLAAGVENAFTNQFIYKSINVLDQPDTNIRSIFDECFAFIDDARKTGTVLVHCNAGISRSATIIVAYLMKNENLIFNKAMETVNAKRAIKPNDGFIRQLKEYDDELRKSIPPPQEPPKPKQETVQRQRSLQQPPPPAPPPPAAAPPAPAPPPPAPAPPPPAPPPPPQQPKTVTKQPSVTASPKPTTPAATPPKPSSPVPPKPASPIPPKPASPVQKAAQPQPKPASPVQRVQTPTKPSSPVQLTVATTQPAQSGGPRVHHIPIRLEADEEEESEEEETDEEEEESEEEEPQPQRSNSKTGHYSQSVTVTIVSKKK